MPCAGLKRFANQFTTFCMAMLFALPLFAQPSIGSFSPLSAPVGSTVTITGSNFNPTTAGNTVYFGSMKAAVTAATPTMLTVTVPAGATHNYISVTANYFTGYSTIPFTVISGAALTPSSYSTRIPFAVTGAYPSSIAVGDLDGDGKADLVCTNFNSNNISVFKNSSISGTVQMQAEMKWPTGNLPEGLAMGDLNSDGKPDLVITSIDDHLISIYMNTSAAGTIAFAGRIDISAGALSWPRGVAIHDMDGDSKPDLIVADNNKIYNLNNTSNGTVSIYRNISVAGAVGFASAVVFATADYPRKTFVSDIDGDGKPDVAVTNNNMSGSVSILRNTSTPGSIAFSARQEFATGSYPEMVVMGDLTEDGKPEMVVSNLASSTLSLFKNISVNGSISFASKQDFPLSAPLGLAIGDITGDGIPDLVAASFASGEVSVYKNTTAGNALSFAPKMDYVSGSDPVQVAIGDIDGDDMPDISLTNSSINFVSVLKMAPGLLVNLGNDTSLCEGDSLVLRVNVPGGQYLWNTGDIQNSITIKQAGRYWVRVTTGGNTVSDTIQVAFKPLPVFDLGSDTILCEGQKVILGPAVTGSYLWQDGSNAESMTVTQSGEYWLRLTQNGCAASDTVNVSYKPLPSVDLGNDTSICPGSTVLLDAGQPNATYLWSNGAAADAISVQNPGVYWVAVGVDGCVAIDSIKIDYLMLPHFPLGNDTTLCEGQTLVLKPEAGNASFIWQDGSTGTTFMVTQPGTYKVTLNNQCETVSDEIIVQRGLCELYMPNAFTPNHDGINDVFRVKYPAFIKNFDMQIFNRWGQIIFRSDNPYKGWDGSFNGTKQPAGNYVWTILLTDVNGNSKRYKGSVLLIQ